MAAGTWDDPVCLSSDTDCDSGFATDDDNDLAGPIAAWPASQRFLYAAATAAAGAGAPVMTSPGAQQQLVSRVPQKRPYDSTTNFGPPARPAAPTAAPPTYPAATSAPPNNPNSSVPVVHRLPGSAALKPGSFQPQGRPSDGPTPMALDPQHLPAQPLHSLLPPAAQQQQAGAAMQGPATLAALLQAGHSSPSTDLQTPPAGVPGAVVAQHNTTTSNGAAGQHETQQLQPGHQPAGPQRRRRRITRAHPTGLRAPFIGPAEAVCLRRAQQRSRQSCSPQPATTGAAAAAAAASKLPSPASRPTASGSPAAAGTQPYSTDGPSFAELQERLRARNNPLAEPGPSTILQPLRCLLDLLGLEAADAPVKDLLHWDHAIDYWWQRIAGRAEGEQPLQVSTVHTKVHQCLQLLEMADVRACFEPGELQQLRAKMEADAAEVGRLKKIRTDSAARKAAQALLDAKARMTAAEVAAAEAAAAAGKQQHGGVRLAETQQEATAAAGGAVQDMSGAAGSLSFTVAELQDHLRCLLGSNSSRDLTRPFQQLATMQQGIHKRHKPSSSEAASAAAAAAAVDFSGVSVGCLLLDLGSRCSSMAGSLGPSAAGGFGGALRVLLGHIGLQRMATVLRMPWVQQRLEGIAGVRQVVQSVCAAAAAAQQLPLPANMAAGQGVSLPAGPAAAPPAGPTAAVVMGGNVQDGKEPSPALNRGQHSQQQQQLVGDVRLSRQAKLTLQAGNRSRLASQGCSGLAARGNTVVQHAGPASHCSAEGAANTPGGGSAAQAAAQPLTACSSCEPGTRWFRAATHSCSLTTGSITGPAVRLFSRLAGACG